MLNKSEIAILTIAVSIGSQNYFKMKQCRHFMQITYSPNNVLITMSCRLRGGCERLPEENETTRNAYQSSELDVAIFTVTESISLHQGELPGGDRPRAQVIHDMRHSAVQLQQIEGRSNRDGSGAVIYYTYAEDTVEEAITARVVTRMASMDGMAGDDTAMLDEIARIIEAAARC